MILVLIGRLIDEKFSLKLMRSTSSYIGSRVCAFLTDIALLSTFLLIPRECITLRPAVVFITLLVSGSAISFSIRIYFLDGDTWNLSLENLFSSIYSCLIFPNEKFLVIAFFEEVLELSNE